MGEKEKGNIFLWLLIIVVFLMVGVLGYFVFDQQKQLKELKNKQLRESVKTVQIGEETIETNKIPDAKSKYAEFYSKLTDKIAKSCPDVRISETKDKKDGDGFFWIEKEEKVEFVKGNTVNLNYNKEGYDKECMELLVKYFDEEFQVNKLNSKKGVVDAYENEDVKCQIWNENQGLSCGIIIKESTVQIYKDLYPYVNPDYDPDITFKINKSEGGYYSIAVGPHFSGGQLSIWKKGEEKWERILKFKETWECDTVIGKKIPPMLVDNECTYEETEEDWKYNEERKEWEKSVSVKESVEE